MVTPLKTLMGFSVHLNVQLKFYNLPYIAPLIDNYNVWTNAFATNMFQDPANFLTNVTSSYNINSVNFALLAPQPMIDVTN
ncbi:hypothetical protein [Ligilactobacillus animalis]|uniref:hypothetical protein n=1 Tax=Ligilactobacillus animalis TaxID=1605 RepID=UPI0026478247|nr:hypothetical protein [Ligilactobacillus animalis]WKB72728.1 hypothetical protein QYH52_00350 [Ligilactobacillus animalis]